MNELSSESTKSTKVSVPWGAKQLAMVAILLATAAVGIASYALLTVNRSRTVVSGPDPKSLALELFRRSRWIGTEDLFEQHAAEVIANTEIVNVLETDGVGIAFVRTSVGKRTFQVCVWMRKTESGWNAVPYLSATFPGQPFIANWIGRNHGWLRDMESRKIEWEEVSQSAW